MENNEAGKFTKEVDVDLFSINDKRLVTEGKITVNFVVADEAPHQLLEQEFIIVDGIVENCVLGRDALYQHHFVYNGKKQTIYRVPEIDHFQEKETPFVIARPLRIPRYSSCVLESGKEGAQVPHSTCHFVKCTNIPTGLDLEPFVSIAPSRSFRVVAINRTNKTIFLPRLTVLGTLSTNKNARASALTIASCHSSLVTVDMSLIEAALPDLEEDIKNKVRELIKENYTNFAFQVNELGHTSLVKHKIDTQGCDPIRQRAYRHSPKQRKVAQEIIDELLENKLIRLSMSPWAAPIVLVQKKTGDVRLCVDFRKLNAITKKDSFPLPRIDDVLDLLQGQQYFSTLDLASGYWQIELEEDSKEKTAFIVDNNLYEWNRLAFGLTNAPGTFQRLMNSVLRSVIGKICLVYLDDIIVFSKTIDEHIKNLKTIFSLLEKAHLKLKLNKCKFLAQSVPYLGHVITSDGIKPDPAKVEALLNYKRPTTVREMQSFLGLASYYRRFVRSFSTIAHPLLILTKGGGSDIITWNEEAISAFEHMRKCLMSEPILIYPDFSEKFLIYTDASNYGVGAVLSQMRDGKDQPVAYASRHFNEPEMKYSTIEKEAAAVVFGIKRFRHYLQDEPFVIISDHRPLQWLQTHKDETGRLGRWAIMLSNMKFTVQYRPGRVHENADFLSRIPMNLILAKPGDNEVMLREQQKDPLCKSILAFLRKNTPWSENDGPMPLWASEIDFFFLEDGLLCRHYEPTSTKRRPFAQSQVVVPLSLRKQLLQEYHDSPLSGHMAYRRTCLRLRDKFFWPTLLADVKQYCFECEPCALGRRVHGVKAFLNPLDLTTKPFEVIGMDFLGPIQPHSLQGNNYVLVITDYFTKWIEVIALPTFSALVTCKALMDRIILRHGPPRAIITDRGSNFTSALFTALCKALNVKHMKTTAYHPQTN